MDKRQQKTRAAISEAFLKLLEKKSYNNITVQEIIDTANIGRSTFYAHFETKDKLLKEMCTEIFDHVFGEDLQKEDAHDFSGEKCTFEDKITHILYHLLEKRKTIKGILSCESGELFMHFFKEYLAQIFAAHINISAAEIPEEYVLNHMVSSFAETVRWWMGVGKSYSPEKIAGFYLRLQSVKLK